KNLENMVNKRNGNTIGARLRTRARAKGWVVGRDVDGRFEPEAGSRPAPGGAGVAGSRVRAGHGPAAGVALGRRVATSANPWADAQVGASPGAGGGADADADVGSVAAARSGAVRNRHSGSPAAGCRLWSGRQRRFGPGAGCGSAHGAGGGGDRKSTRLNSSHVKISYAVFCLKKKIQ